MEGDRRVCATCGTPNDDAARFCGNCGSRLGGAAPSASIPSDAAQSVSTPTPPGAERKTISVLFCDLVGFTATSEGADPEDVEQMLSRYFAVARSQIEAHGGVVEKFIGDAVVGVFGVPGTHEDDPERAVRAALRICDDAATLPALGGAPLRLRVGVNTGEALVRLHIQPGAGIPFMTGDTVNTASRIQSVAPEMGVAVGPATHEATRTRFEYEELAPATLKGKAEPVRVFRPIAPLATLGIDLTRARAGLYVGRDEELGTLTQLFDAALAGRSLRFATIVGVPGLGKSRLAAELLAYVDAQPMLVTWRQGRCLPYGAGISFWALGEIVKAHAGILESDPVAIATAKLDAVLPGTDERGWFRERLLPLLGVGSGIDVERAEQFVAWRRFLEHLAAERPTVLVFEDLHWADDAMLAFLEELVERSTTVPLLVLATSRPELDDRRPGFPGGSTRAIRIDLGPLPDDAAERLASSLLETGALAPSLRDPILEHAAGNPLFVEEFVRLLRDRDLLAPSDGGSPRLREGASLPVPQTIQALLAARLDTLAPDQKGMLGDASVVGKVFWAGAIAAMGERDPQAVERTLLELGRREFVRPSERSSMGGEREYGFWHILARDVAYAALPRAARASRHVAAAAWIESKAAGRIDDVADILAHHYSTALHLAQAMGDFEQSAALEAPAFRFLSLASERSLLLDAPVAVGLLERASVLAAPGHPDRGATLERLGIAFLSVGRLQESLDALDEAIDLDLARGDRAAAGRAMLARAETRRLIGIGSTTREALALLEAGGPTAALAVALQRAATDAALNGSDTTLDLLRRMRAIADAIEPSQPSQAQVVRAGALGVEGLARSTLGDLAGLDDFREAIRIGTEAGDGIPTAARYNNFAVLANTLVGPEVALRAVEDGLAFARARGLKPVAAFLASNGLNALYDAGLHDRLIAEFPSVDRQLDELGITWMRIEPMINLLLVRSLRGEPTDPAERVVALELLRESGDPDYVGAGLGALALANVVEGDSGSARALLEEAAGIDWANTPACGARLVPIMARTALKIGDVALAARLGNGLRTSQPARQAAIATRDAAVLEARGELADAAAGYAAALATWQHLGMVVETAFARLGLGRTLLGLGQNGEAVESLRAARSIFSGLQAAPSLAEIDDLLEGVS